MAHLNFAKHELTCKLVYCGPGLSGKTTNLEAIHARTPADRRGTLCSIATQGDRTLFFDHMPLDLGRSPGGVGTKLQLYTVPGQPCYASTRTLVLQGVDGVVFVADSRPEALEANLEALRELERSVKVIGRDLADLPLVFQWNKQDLPGRLHPAALEARLNPGGRPSFAASAVLGDGVLETLRALSAQVLEKCAAELRGEEPASPRSSSKKLKAIPPTPAPAAPPARASSKRLQAVKPATPARGERAKEPSPTRGEPRRVTRIVEEAGERGYLPLASSDIVAASQVVTPVLQACPPAPSKAPTRDGGLREPVHASALLSATSVVAPLPQEACPWSSADALAAAAALASDEDTAIGQVVGGCRILHRLGEGGMGVVYVARHETLGKHVVVKVLKQEYARSRRRVERFFLEARAAARLEHPNIVQVQDLGTNDGGLHYIIMQFVDGQNLAERLRAAGRLPHLEATRIVLAAARALVVMHDAGIVHRDIKAENIVVTRGGEVKVIDFGLVKDLNQDLGLTRQGALVGTPLYMAPEIGRVERIDGRADLYSLGLTWYYALTGRPPFEGHEVHDVIFGRARLSAPEVEVQGLPADLTRVLDGLLARARERRYGDARTLVADLEALLEGRPAKAPQVPAAELPWRGREAAEAAQPPSSDDETAALDREVQAASLDPACHVGPLVLLEVVDASGAGVLYRAWDSRPEGGLCAVRLLDGVRKLEPAAAAGLEAARRLRHPHLVTPGEHGLLEDGRLWVMADWRPARTLEAAAPGLEPAEVARVVRDAARALTHAHEKGVHHGALGPGSVFVDGRGQGLLADLGLALAEGERESRRQRLAQRLGRSGSVPPERQGDLPAGAADDAFALGAMLQRALGLTACGGRIRDLEAIWQRATASSPSRRYATAGELARDLDRFLAGEAPAARPPKPARPAPKYAVAGAVGVLLAALVILGSAWRQSVLMEEQARRLETMLERIEPQQR